PVFRCLTPWRESDTWHLRRLASQAPWHLRHLAGLSAQQLVLGVFQVVLGFFQFAQGLVDFVLPAVAAGFGEFFFAFGDFFAALGDGGRAFGAERGVGARAARFGQGAPQAGLAEAVALRLR